MSDHTYKKIEVVGTSTTSFDDAVRNAIRRTSETVQHLRWFEVTDMRGDITDGNVAHFQATLKIGFRLHDANE
jgi:flavin-binding protein dodecin